MAFTGCRSGAEVETRLPLGSATFAAPALAVAAEWGGLAVAGTPLPLTLRLRNLTPALQDVGVAITESSGFVFAGPSHAVPSSSAITACCHRSDIYICGSAACQLYMRPSNYPHSSCVASYHPS